MGRDSLVERFELFFATSTVAAHASTSDRGFRQRDVKFLIELFSNWIESALGEQTLAVRNTQISRYLDDLVQDGFLRQISHNNISHSRRPTYRLSRIGLLELISCMVNRTYIANREQFFFLFYFVRSYKPRLERLVREEGRQFPMALRIELDALLNEEALLERELNHAKLELRKLEHRVSDSTNTACLARDWQKAGRSVDEIIAEAERLYPYELNSQKPLTELMASIPEEYRLWELSQGNQNRVQMLWQPSKAMLEEYIKQLSKLVGC